MTVARERCTRSYVLTVARRTRFLSSLQRGVRFTAVSASRSAGRREGTSKLGRASSATGFRDRLILFSFFWFLLCECTVAVFLVLEEGGVLPALEQGWITPGSRDPVWPGYDRAVVPLPATIYPISRIPCLH